MGILAVVFSVYGVVFAILALVFGYRAKRAIKASRGILGGAGMATAGQVLGWVWVGLAALIALVVVLTIGGGGGADELVYRTWNETVSLGPDQTYLQGFWVPADGTVAAFDCTEATGRNVTCAIHPVADSSAPHLGGGAALAVSEGPRASGSAVLPEGRYALTVQCPDATERCNVMFTLELRNE